MEFGFSPQEEAFRREVRAFLDREIPAEREAEIEMLSDEEYWEFGKSFLKKLAQRGWATPAWPREYGGAGLSIMEQLVYNEEMAYRGAPLINGPGIGLAGPLIILHGNEEQKRRHLPGIAAGETFWCQGFSEPGAGSDLASLQTRAIRDGDEYVVNGGKIWTSYAHRAHWVLLMARSDPDAPKHRGVSFFLLDLSTPGITVQPLWDMTNRHHFNQVFFENVRVPRENMLGEENRGWYVGASGLDIERSSIAQGSRAKRHLEYLVGYCRQNSALLTSLAVRHKLAEMAIEIEVGRYLSYRVASIQARGQVPNMESAEAKLYLAELSQRMSKTAIEVAGLCGQLERETEWAPLAGRIKHQYLRGAAATIGGGTSEMQRNVIAARGLGLPRA
jgi:alkylation response protein AidB-like acyl-CoA dehydrogenase